MRQRNPKAWVGPVLGLLGLVMGMSLSGISSCENPDDLDGDGYTSTDGDCDDNNDTIYPGAPEGCDARDNDCDGSTDEGLSCGGIIATVAGTGVSGFSGDGGPAYEAELNGPRWVALAPDGAYFVADVTNNRIRRVDSAGIITTIAGTGVAGYSGDGGPALAAQLSAPSGLALDGRGRLLIADFNNCRVRRIDETGVISTVAGNGIAGYSGDGGLATAASLKTPYDVVVLPDNSFYVSDSNNYRVRYVGADGRIQTAVGDGTCSLGADGKPPAQTSICIPGGLTLDEHQGLYFTETYNNRVRRVVNGVVQTVAGLGYAGYYGEGIPATEALLSRPQDLVFDSAGNLYLSDNGNYRVRRVNTQGLIETVAGTGVEGYSGDGGPALEAKLGSVQGLAMRPSDVLLLPDGTNAVVRQVVLGM